MGALQKKYSNLSRFKETTLELYINCRIRKRYIHCVSRAFAEKKEAEKRKTTDCHSTELIGYLTQGVMFKYCTVLGSLSNHDDDRVDDDRK